MMQDYDTRGDLEGFARKYGLPSMGSGHARFERWVDSYPVSYIDVPSVIPLPTKPVVDLDKFVQDEVFKVFNVIINVMDIPLAEGVENITYLIANELGVNMEEEDQPECKNIAKALIAMRAKKEEIMIAYEMELSSHIQQLANRNLAELENRTRLWYRMKLRLAYASYEKELTGITSAIVPPLPSSSEYDDRVHHALSYNLDVLVLQAIFGVGGHERYYVYDKDVFQKVYGRLPARKYVFTLREELENNHVTPPLTTGVSPHVPLTDEDEVERRVNKLLAVFPALTREDILDEQWGAGLQARACEGVMNGADPPQEAITYLYRLEGYLTHRYLLYAYRLECLKT